MDNVPVADNASLEADKVQQEIRLLNAHYTFFYTNLVFLAQFMFSLFGAAFCASMLYVGKDATVYLPILTSIISVWIPNPRVSFPGSPDIQPSLMPTPKLATTKPLVKSKLYIPSKPSLGARLLTTNDAVEALPDIDNLRNLHMPSQSMEPV